MTGICRESKCRGNDLRTSFKDVIFLATHNSHTQESRDQNHNALDGDNFSNQKYSMYDQITTFGVQGLMIDIAQPSTLMKLAHWNDDAGTEYYGNFISRMNEEVLRALNDNPDLVLWFDLQINDNVGYEELINAVAGISGIRDMIFDIESSVWNNHADWPTLQEMIDADQRVVVFSDKLGRIGPFFKSDSTQRARFLYKEYIMWENMFGNDEWNSCVARKDGDEDWTDNAGPNDNIAAIPGRSWSRLLTLNHFPKIEPRYQESNDMGMLDAHIYNCMQVHNLRR